MDLLMTARRSPRRRSDAFARALSRIGGAQGGNVAVIFALCAVLVVGLATFGIDLARASRVKQDLQERLDAATLAGARVADSGSPTDTAKLALLAQTSGVEGLEQLKYTFKENGDVLTGTATGQVKAMFPLLHMGKPFNIAATTDVKRGISGALEVALVLDTTFSMTGASGSKTKMDALKVAATDLVKTLKKEPKADVKIAVIPFAQYVNVGVGRRNETWMNVGADYTTGTAQVCKTTYNPAITQETTCAAYEKKTCTGTKDGTSYTYSCNGACTKTKVTNYGSQGKPSTSCTGGYTTYKFFGCVGSPAYPQNVQDSDPNRKYPGLLQTSSSCGSEITPLTTNQGTVISAINALTAVGETYIPSGLAWGFNALSQAKPLTEAAPYDPSNIKPRKAIVLMTDGENTKYLQPKSTPAGMHNGNSATAPAPASQTNDFTLELCTNAKKAGIEIYTISFQVTNAAAKDLMKKCASDADHNFDASNSAKLDEAFAAIADSLKNIFISR
jgi:Flp pilus assembly protein TadG